MADVTSVQSSVLDQYALVDPNKTKSNEMGRDQFLELMIAQLNNQNPLEPKENGDFIAQLAQFSTVEGIESMGTSLDDMSANFKSNQAIQASSLVGKHVTIEGKTDTDLNWGEYIYGSVEIPAGMDNLHLQIINEKGDKVEDISLGYQSNGESRFIWNGAQLEFNDDMIDIDLSKLETDEEGRPIPHAEGNYQFKLVGTSEGQQQEMAISMSARVDSVSITGGSELVLNLSGNETTSLLNVKQIN
ncbi:flagellar hook assembly protein FlgD [Marinicellulosiphila megalodicopiae]|uniref:flagellar hook assembly protein FlgD n=1 Tax=Marinicellulosiphila megalodicopiae TaxID=2724896 RepID=UPI003BAE32FB